MYTHLIMLIKQVHSYNKTCSITEADIHMQLFQITGEDFVKCYSIDIKNGVYASFKVVEMSEIKLIYFRLAQLWEQARVGYVNITTTLV